MPRIPRTTLLAATFALVAVVALSLFDMGGWDPTRLLRVGEQAASREFVTADIEDVTLVPGWGHDGQANYVLASVFPDLADADTHVDSVTYRSRRIVYPALLSVVPSGMPLAIAMWVLNLAAIAAAAAFVAAESRRLGGHWIAGATVGIAPGFLASALLGLGDALALALGVAGLWLWRTERSTAGAIALLALAGLTRETTLVITAALLLAGLVAGAHERRRSTLLMIPPAIVLGWIAVLSVVIGDADKSAAQFRPPFAGWFDPRTGSTQVMVAGALLLGSVWASRRLWSIDRGWSLIVAFEAAVLVCLDRAVLFHPLNVGRVVAWVIPLAVIALTATGESESDDVSQARPDASARQPATLPGG